MTVEFVRVTDDTVDQLAEALSDLDEQMRGRWRDPSRCLESTWRWCYVEAPGGGGVATVALRDGRVIGKNGSVLLPMEAAGRETLGSLMEGLAVDPEERSWNCFRGLLAESATASIERGVRLGHAFTTREAGRLNTQLGNSNLGYVPVLLGLIDAGSIATRYGLPRVLAHLLVAALGVRRGIATDGDVEIRRGDRFDNRHTGLWSGEAISDRISVVKDARYLSWRYLQCPGRGFLARPGLIVGA